MSVLWTPLVVASLRPVSRPEFNVLPICDTELEASRHKKSWLYETDMLDDDLLQFFCTATDND